MTTAKKKLKNRVRCSGCKTTVGFIPDEYELGVDILCSECNGTKKKRKKKAKTVRTAAGNYAKTKGGIRKEIHPTYYFRSATEANVARLFDFLEASWKFEERTFTFSGYKTKPWMYIMDFEITRLDKRKKLPEWLTTGFVEVKGYMNSQSRQKLRRLVKHYPEEAKDTLVILYDKYRKKDMKFCDKYGYRWITYDTLVKEYGPQIQGWE